MGVFTARNGLARAQRVEAEQLECGNCGTVSFALRATDGPFEQLTLSAFAEPVEPVEVDCPRCPGHRLRRGRTYAGFLPDEPELAALCWERQADDDAPEWFLLDVEIAENEPEARFALALTAGRNRRPLPVPDEETLEREWGRPLSVRSRWRLLLADVESSGTACACDPAPGLRLVASPVPPPDQRTIETLLAVMPPGSTEMVRLSCNPTDPNGAGTWAGPWADKLDSTMIAYSLVDVDEVDRRIAQAALQWKIEPQLDPPAGQKQPVVDPETGHDALWFRRGEITLPILAREVTAAAAVGGTTIAEAAQLVVSQEAHRAELVLRLADHLQAAGAEVIVRHTRELELVSGSRSLVLEPVRILTRFGLNPDAPGLLAEVERIAAAVKQQDRSLLDTLLCSCGQTRMTAQLRPEGFLDQRDDPPPIVSQTTDERGQPFVLVAALECPHQVNMLLGEGARLLTEEGWDVAEQIRSATLPDLYAKASVVRDADGAAGSVALEGTNIATALAPPELVGELYELVSDVFAPQTELVAFAPTTHLVVVVPRAEIMQLRLDGAVAGRLNAGPLPGTPLGFTRTLRAHPQPSRLITLEWQREPAGRLR